jgi:hypothetical protein
MSLRQALRDLRYRQRALDHDGAVVWGNHAEAMDLCRNCVVSIPNGGGYLRETCLAPMEFDQEDRIKKVDPLAPVVPDGTAVDGGTAQLPDVR